MNKINNLGKFGKKGAIPWNKGVKYDKNMKNKINTTGLTGVNGREPWNKGKGGYTTSKKGCVVSQEVRLKISNSLKGNIPWNKNIDPSYRMLDKRLRDKFRNYMQKEIFERDNYTCQMCNATKVHLQVDHIQSWSNYVELRFSMDNCRTLCQKCHYKITYGREMPVEVKTWGQNFGHIEREG